MTTLKVGIASYTEMKACSLAIARGERLVKADEPQGNRIRNGLDKRLLRLRRGSESILPLVVGPHRRRLWMASQRALPS